MYTFVIILLSLPVSWSMKPLFGGLSLSVQVPQTGPCVLNDDNLKCTKQGYYETVQCDKSSCFCVDAHNGQIAEFTRTHNKKTAPTCSACHNYLGKLFANGDLPQKTYIPKCDTRHGDYHPLQCDGAGEFCFCVDPKTGKELQGTRRENSDNEIMSCSSTEDSSHHRQRNSTETYPLGNSHCKLSVDRGQKCSNESSRIYYFFDVETFTCLAFEHKGCGGNDNKFLSSSECYQSCLLMDFSSCAGLTTPAKDSKGQTILCGGGMPVPFNATMDPNLNEDGCPKKYRCSMGAFFGFCCDTATEEKYSREQNPTCAHGNAYSIQKDGYDQKVIGKSCSHDFCPSKYSCHQGEVFAHCCPSELY